MANKAKYPCHTKKIFDLNEFKIRKKCEKIIGKSKYERPNQANKIWWQEVFNSLERKYGQPRYKKTLQLREAFSWESLDDLIDIGIEISQDLPRVKLSAVTDVSEIVDSSRQAELDSLGIKKKTEFKHVKVENPYLNFMKKPDRDAQIWRPHAEVSFDKLTLNEKADRTTEKIAAEFDAWFSSMGGQRKSEIDKEILLELFQMTFDYPAATSLCVRVKELGSVPHQVAEALHRPEYSESETIRRHINRDSELTRKPPHMVAFGQTLPREFRRKPVVEDIKEKWLKCDVYHEDLATMAAAFKDITDLRVTRAFCLWLLDHPEITPPKFLVDIGMMDKKVLTKPAVSIYNTTDLETAETTAQVGFLKPETTVSADLSKPSIKLSQAPRSQLFSAK